MGISGCSQRGLELCLRGTLMGNERLSKGSIMMASRGVMRKQSFFSTAPPSIIYMVIRCSSYRLLCLIYFAYFCYFLYLLPAAPALWPCKPASEATSFGFFADLGVFYLKSWSSSCSSHPPDKLHSCLLFFLSTSPPLRSLPASILPPPSLHFFLSWCSPGNLIQTEYKGE